MEGKRKCRMGRSGRIQAERGGKMKGQERNEGREEKMEKQERVLRNGRGSRGGRRKEVER